MFAYPFILSSGIVVIVAQVNFTRTINLGAVLLGVMIVIGFAWASRQDKRSERWQKLYDLADHERKELQHELNDAREVLAEQKEVIQKLEALQMPTKVMEIMTEGIKSLNDHAANRQSEIRESVIAALDNHERRAEDRNQKHLTILQMIADQLGNHEAGNGS